MSDILNHLNGDAIKVSHHPPVLPGAKARRKIALRVLPELLRRQAMTNPPTTKREVCAEALEWAKAFLEAEQDADEDGPVDLDIGGVRVGGLDLDPRD